MWTKLAISKVLIPLSKLFFLRKVLNLKTKIGIIKNIKKLFFIEDKETCCTWSSRE